MDMNINKTRCGVYTAASFINFASSLALCFMDTNKWVSICSLSQLIAFGAADGKDFFSKENAVFLNDYQSKWFNPNSMYFVAFVNTACSVSAVALCATNDMEAAYAVIGISTALHVIYTCVLYKARMDAKTAKEELKQKTKNPPILEDM